MAVQVVSSFPSCEDRLGVGWVANRSTVASPTTGGSGSAESTGSTGSTTKPPSDTTIISGVSGALEPVGKTVGLLGVVLFGALLL